MQRRQTSDAARKPAVARAPENFSMGGVAQNVRGDAPAIFDPQLLAKLGRLDLIAQTVVDGFLSGKHRSTHKGGCTDFAEFRPYARGDSIRLLDWRHFARSDRYYVKCFDDETNLQALLIVDASGSMSFGMSTVSKWQYAQMAAACLAHLLLRQRDSVGAALMGSSLLNFVKPQPRAGHLARVLTLLQTTHPQGPSSLPDMLNELTTRLKRRGMVILLSDCFGDVLALKQSLERFRHHGHDVVVLQTLAPEELTFPFRREALFQDLELHKRLQINPNSLRKAYLEEFQKFMDELQNGLTSIGVDLMTFTTSDNLGDVLAYHLHRRAAQKKSLPGKARG
jgi:uncharacterized protein (DUF58 family)